MALLASFRRGEVRASWWKRRRHFAPREPPAFAQVFG